MKRNNYKAILTLFALAFIIFGGSVAGHAQAQYRKALDFDGDGKADLTVNRYENSGYSWYTRNSQTGALKSARWGGANFDFPCAGDFDGDGKADYCITRRLETGMVWYIMQSNGTFRTQAFGVQFDRPMPADYDGDGKADIAVWRGGGSSSSPINWYILQSSNNQLVVRHSGTDAAASDICSPLPAVDIDGDGKQDIAQTCSTSSNTLLWSITRSSNGAVERYYWGIKNPDGNNNDVPVPADYDGDGKTDVAVVRETDTGNSNSSLTWYIRRSSDGALQAAQFGGSNSSINYYDTAIPADYDGDGKADIAVYRSRSGVVAGALQYFYTLRSGSGGSLLSAQWGVKDDRPVVIPTDYLTF